MAEEYEQFKKEFIFDLEIELTKQGFTETGIEYFVELFENNMEAVKGIYEQTNRPTSDQPPT
jgi:hypothetical protein